MEASQLKIGMEVSWTVEYPNYSDKQYGEVISFDSETASG